MPWFRRGCFFQNFYKKGEVEIKGNIFASDERDKKSKLYPLTLYRKKNVQNISVNFIQDGKEVKKKFHLILAASLLKAIAELFMSFLQKPTSKRVYLILRDTMLNLEILV